MPALGKDQAAPPFGTGVISATYTEECELVDISNRDNTGSGPAYKVSAAGFVTKTWEIECHDGSSALTSLLSDGTGFQVMSVTENISVDGAKTFSITAKEF